MFLLTAAASPFALSRWADFFANFGEFAKGFLYTLGMSICALILAFVLGVIFGAMSSSKSRVLKAISRVYVEVFQNTPLLVQFVFVYYGLAIMTNGVIMISTFFTAVLCVGIYHGAYIAEVIRSGIEAVPKGQTEAALSQGFTYSQTMSLIILPQAYVQSCHHSLIKWLNLIKIHQRSLSSQEQTSCLQQKLGHMKLLTMFLPLLVQHFFTSLCVSLLQHGHVVKKKKTRNHIHFRRRINVSINTYQH